MKRCKDCKWETLDGNRWPCRDCVGSDKYRRKWWKFRAPKVLLIALVLLLGGCGVDVSYKDELGREFRYRRIGPQQIGEVLLEFPDGSTFLMDGQKSEMPPVKITLPQGIIIESGGKAVK